MIGGAAQVFPFFLLRQPLFQPITMRWAAGGLVMKTVILNNFFSPPTFCPLLTGLVRLAHLVLDQGLWEGGRD